MVWKILFVFTFIVSVLSGIMSYTSDISSFTNTEWFIGVLMSFTGAFIMGIFYTLGWNRRIFSVKAIKIFLSIFILTMISYLFVCQNQTYPALYEMFASEPLLNSQVILVASIIGTLFFALICNIFLLPFYIGIRQYCKNVDNINMVSKPYWKLFAIYSVSVLIAPLLYSFSMFNNFVNYNWFDFIVILSNIFEIIFITAFAWNKKIFHKLFWQITFIPYVIF